MKRISMVGSRLESNSNSFSPCPLHLSPHQTHNSDVTHLHPHMGSPSLPPRARVHRNSRKRHHRSVGRSLSSSSVSCNATIVGTLKPVCLFPSLSPSSREASRDDVGDADLRTDTPITGLACCWAPQSVAVGPSSGAMMRERSS